MMARLTVVWVQHFSKRFTQVVSYLILETLCGLPNYCYYFKVKKLGLQEVKSLALPPQLDLEVLDIKLRACDYKISALSFTQPFFCETVCYSILTPTLTPPPQPPLNWLLLYGLIRVCNATYLYCLPCHLGKWARRRVLLIVLYLMPSVKNKHKIGICWRKKWINDGTEIQNIISSVNKIKCVRMTTWW